MKHAILSALTLGMFVLPLHAQAEDQKKTTVKIAPVTIATDKNGNVTLATARGLAEKQFALFDKDKDGSFEMKDYRIPFDAQAKTRKSPSKNKAADEKAIADSYARMDNDKNSKISKAEYMSDAELRHKTLDTNGDGVVTPKELEDLQKKITAAHKKATK